MQKTVLSESDAGLAIRIEKIPSSLFTFYIQKKRTFKDGTHQYDLCVDAGNNSHGILKLDRVRGHKRDAVKRLEEIIRNS